jgi:osmotically-inducible protein OsmY
MIISLTGCVPVIVGGGMLATGTVLGKKKGMSGTISDSSISLSIKSHFYNQDPNIYAEVGINVQSGDVLLTGNVSKAERKKEAERLAWTIEGVENVYNYINITQVDDKHNVFKDSWITTQIKTKMLGAEDIRSVNYSIKTVNGVVYLMGYARTQKELDMILGMCQNLNGVDKVISMVKISQKNQNQAQEHSTPKETKTG